MTRPGYVGSWPVRAVAAGGATLTATLAWTTPWPAVNTYALVAVAILTALAVIHSSATLFSAWMRFAAALQGVMVVVLFGVSYLVVIPLAGPFVWLRDPLKLRAGRRDTFWVRRDSSVTPVSLERMG